MSRFPTVDRMTAFLSGWPRRAAALLCLLAAALTLATGRHTSPVSTPVVVAGRALAAGAILRPTDLRVITWPDDAPPAAAARSPGQLIGRRIAVALARGMPIGDDALIGPAIARALSAGRTVATVRLTTSDALALIQAGSSVDLYPDGGESSDLIEGKSVTDDAAPGPMAIAVQVLSVLPGKSADASNTNPTLVIAVDKATATKLTAHTGTTFVATLVQPP